MPIEFLARAAWIEIARYIVNHSQQSVQFARQPMNQDLLTAFCRLNSAEQERLRRKIRDPDQWMKACFEQDRPTWPAGLFAFMFAPEAPQRSAYALLSEQHEFHWQDDSQAEPQPELITLSPLGLADDRRTAMVFYSTDGTQSCAAGTLLILDLVDGVWVVRRRVTCWIS